MGYKIIPTKHFTVLCIIIYIYDLNSFFDDGTHPKQIPAIYDIVV